ncbi:MAG: TOBE domain-containing protein, partial [Oceanospirillaceae bacterium]
GIRPEFIQLSTVEHQESLPCQILHTEDLGTYKIVSIKVGGQTIKVRLGEDQHVPSENAYATFPNPWVKIYVDEYLIDPQTGDIHDE